MAIVKRAISTIPTFDGREKGTIEEIENKKLTLDFYAVSTNADGEALVSVVTKEIPDKFYFASGKLKDFLIDNVQENPDIICSDDNSIRFNPEIDGEIHFIYEGKKVSKKNRTYNAWNVII